MMICKSCGNLRERYEDFYNLSVEVKNQKTLYDGLKKFIPVFEPLYVSMSDTQKKNADALFHRRGRVNAKAKAK